MVLSKSNPTSRWLTVGFGMVGPLAGLVTGVVRVSVAGVSCDGVRVSDVSGYSVQGVLSLQVMSRQSDVNLLLVRWLEC